MKIKLLHLISLSALVTVLYPIQQTQAQLSQLDFAGSARKKTTTELSPVSSPQAPTSSKGHISDVNPGAVKKHSDAVNKKVEERERKKRLEYHDYKSKQIKQQRENLRAKRREMERKNKNDKDEYNRRCGVGGDGSRAACSSARKRIRERKASRKKSLSSYRSRTTSRRKR